MTHAELSKLGEMIFDAACISEQKRILRIIEDTFPTFLPPMTRTDLIEQLKDKIGKEEDESQTP